MFVADEFWTLDRIAEALAPLSQVNLPRGSRAIRRIATDTRSLEQGDVFVALKGETFDGHDFLADAVKRGAAAVVVSKPPKLGELGVPVYEVDDTLVALGRLARFWRRAWGKGSEKSIVAVAGSNGKTSTKDLIRAALSETYDVHATTGNLNNRIGVPLTLLAMPAECDVAIVELGTSLPGEIALLREIVEPDIVVVTSIAEEHLEGLGDLAGVLREEAAAYDGAAVGIAPAEQPEIAAAAKSKVKKLVVAGLDVGHDFSAESWHVGPDGVGHVEIDGLRIAPQARGIHNLRNTMLALAVARELAVDPAAARRGIESMSQPKMRTAWTQIGRLTLINDVYNANPGSTRAAIEMLAGADPKRQRVIVLGTMRELGATSDKLHDEIVSLALQSGADIVAGIGDFEGALNRTSVAGGERRVITARDVNELWPKLQSRLQPDAIILLKASRGVQLERLVPHLTIWAKA